MKTINIRVYYEDTDHGGVVYHANYLKYMERGRTEALRDLGFAQSELSRQEDIVFVVTRTDVRFLRPARFDDELVVITELVEARGARLGFKQQIQRQGEKLVEADIFVACMSNAGKAKRIPAHMLKLMHKGKI